MSESKSKRLRLRLSESDERCLDDAFGATLHPSRSEVIRAAIGFFCQVASNVQGGFRVVYRHADSPEQPPVFGATALAGGETGGRPLPRGKSLEFRAGPADCEQLAMLVRYGAGPSNSEVIRRAVRVYAEAAARSRDGWQVVAVSPSNDRLVLPVPGVVRGEGVAMPVAGPGAGAGVGSGPGPGDRVGETAPAADASCSAFDDDLHVRLCHRAAETGRSPEQMLNEIVRAALEASGGQGAAGSGNEEHVNALRDVLERMAGNVERIIELLDTSEKSSGEQADFSELLFANVTGTERESDSDDGGASAVARLLERAEGLSETLDSLLALAESRGAGEPLARGVRSVAAEGRAARGKAVKTGLPKPMSEEWALVVATDANGAPQQQVVESQTIIPLGDEDL